MVFCGDGVGTGTGVSVVLDDSGGGDINDGTLFDIGIKGGGDVIIVVFEGEGGRGEGLGEATGEGDGPSDLQASFSQEE